MSSAARSNPPRDRSRSRARAFALAAFTAIVLFSGGALLAGCGAGETESPGPDYARELAGSPRALAALHKQENRLLDGGLPAFEQRMEELRGYPAVVNLWASWCGPCRAEFPHFQGVAARMGKRVAFLAVNPDDDDAAAATFLETNPVPYPSYTDPDKEIADHLGVPRMIPATVFFDPAGEKTYVKYGSYADEEALIADIRTHAMRRGGS